MSNAIDVPLYSRFADELPADSELTNSPRQVERACYSPVAPTPVRDPHIIGWTHKLAETFGLKNPQAGSPIESWLAGNLQLPNMKPFAACYGGHQFGHWAGQLGDGRAIALGELRDLQGQLWEIQLKGAGPTPYSRRADGRAVLRSSIREFLASEAMFHLGVPTTRALSVVTTGESVMRDMFYDGNPQNEQGAIVARMAPTFVRFGNFEILAARNDKTTLKLLLDWVVVNFFGELGQPNKSVYIQWYKEVCRRTAVMICHWLRVGFVHGVMNTDNMSILGLTIDYGPFGFLDNFDPNWTPNTTDLPGRRYCFGRQAAIALWNLERLGDAILPLVGEAEPLVDCLETYQTTLHDEYLRMNANKLGLESLSGEEDFKIVRDLDRILQLTEIDYTIFYRQLARVQIDETLEKSFTSLEFAFYLSPDQSIRQEFLQWLSRYQNRLKLEKQSADDRVTLMNRTNPKYILRNYMAHQAITAAENGDFSVFNEIQQLLAHPYDEQPENEKWFTKRPDWARAQPGCSTLSCSS